MFRNPKNLSKTGSLLARTYSTMATKDVMFAASDHPTYFRGEKTRRFFNIHILDAFGIRHGLTPKKEITGTDIVAHKEGFAHHADDLSLVSISTSPEVSRTFMHASGCLLTIDGLKLWERPIDIEATYWKMISQYPDHPEEEFACYLLPVYAIQHLEVQGVKVQNPFYVPGDTPEILASLTHMTQIHQRFLQEFDNTTDPTNKRMLHDAFVKAYMDFYQNALANNNPFTMTLTQWIDKHKTFFQYFLKENPHLPHSKECLTELEKDVARANKKWFNIFDRIEKPNLKILSKTFLETFIPEPQSTLTNKPTK